MADERNLRSWRYKFTRTFTIWIWKASLQFTNSKVNSTIRNATINWKNCYCNAAPKLFREISYYHLQGKFLEASNSRWKITIFESSNGFEQRDSVCYSSDHFACICPFGTVKQSVRSTNSAWPCTFEQAAAAEQSQKLHFSPSLPLH